MWIGVAVITFAPIPLESVAPAADELMNELSQCGTTREVADLLVTKRIIGQRDNVLLCPIANAFQEAVGPDINVMVLSTSISLTGAFPLVVIGRQSTMRYALPHVVEHFIEEFDEMGFPELVAPMTEEG
jgi:hypothetical protein